MQQQELNEIDTVGYTLQTTANNMSKGGQHVGAGVIAMALHTLRSLFAQIQAKESELQDVRQELDKAKAALADALGETDVTPEVGADGP